MQQRVIISKAVDHIANGLFCMFQSLGVAPPILLMKENDVLQQKICQRLSDLFKQHSAMSESQPAAANRNLMQSSKRCFLILLDRYDDL